jgi:hypothetical protein
MNNQPQKILSAEQSALVAELTTAYGIEPEDIIFFGNDPKPFLTYEATCALCNQLTNMHDISIEPQPSGFVDSLAYRCTLTLSDGRTRSAVGVANIKETADEKPMSEQQLVQVASSRAIRNALKTAGIDLLKLHLQFVRGEVDSLNFKSNYASLIAQAHILGKEAGLINGDDKFAWYRLIENRYGQLSSNSLSETELADFVAVLKTLVPQVKRAA